MMDYDDIINLPHYELRYHERMSSDKRAAQFASFDALTGYKEEIKEERRLTAKEKILTEEEIEILNQKLQNLIPHQRIKITYFIPDKRKEGGSYATIEGNYKRLDLSTQELIFETKQKIKLQTLLSLEEIDENKS